MAHVAFDGLLLPSSNLQLDAVISTTKAIHHLATLPETNIAPKNGWLEYKPFLLGFGLFSGAFAVSFREGNYLARLIVDVPHLPSILGAEVFEPDVSERLTVGVAMGLGVSATGGAFFFHGDPTHKKKVYGCIWSKSVQKLSSNSFTPK